MSHYESIRQHCHCDLRSHILTNSMTLWRMPEILYLSPRQRSSLPADWCKPHSKEKIVKQAASFSLSLVVFDIAYILAMLAASPPSYATASMMDKQNHSDAPPPYSPSKNFDHSTDEEKSGEQFFPPTQPDEPGFAVASALSRGLQVPSRTAACSSGFDYPDELSQYGISKDHWRQFTQPIRDESKLSRQQWTTVIGKGLGALAIGGLMIGFFSTIPAAFVARNAQKRQERRNLIASMAGVHGGRLPRHISYWNESFFRPRGVLIRVDLPDEYIDDMNDMDLHESDAPPQSAAKARNKAALKARIVIIPLNGSSLASGSNSSIAQGGAA